MALIKCPECGKDFSDRANTCPNCAYPLTNLDRIALGIIDSTTALNEGEERYRAKDFAGAFEVFSAVAKTKNPQGLFSKGVMLVKGQGTTENVEKGLDCLKESADLGNGDAMLFLGNFYEKQDKAKSLENYKACLNIIDTFEKDAQGVIYKNCGEMWSSSDFEKKAELLEKALAIGEDVKNTLSQLYLDRGVALLENGKYSESEPWLLKAQKLTLKADGYLGKCYYYLSKEKNSRELLEKSARYGYKEAKADLGKVYLKDYENTGDVECLEKSSSLGNKQAMEKLSVVLNNEGARLYSRGEDDDILEAEKLLKRSADLGNSDAKRNLSVVYNQLGVDFYNGENDRTLDFDKAEDYFQKAVSLGNENARQNLALLYNQYGLMYRDGKNTKVNLALAEDYFKKAMGYGCEVAKHNLIMGYINAYFNYKHGSNGYIRDPAKANENLDKAQSLDSQLILDIAKDYYNRAKDIARQGIDYSNYKQVNSYLRRASRLGKEDLTRDLVAFYKLISSYYKKGKRGFTKNKFKANIYMKKAAELGDEEVIKRYKPPKEEKRTFDKITGFNTTALKKGKNKYYNYPE